MQPAGPELSSSSIRAHLQAPATNTYFLPTRMLTNWGLVKRGKVSYDLFIDEMKDAAN